MTARGRSDHPFRHCEAHSPNPVIARRAAPWQSAPSSQGVTMARSQSGKGMAFCLGKSTHIVVAPPAA